jgi:hypothetical protein
MRLRLLPPSSEGFIRMAKVVAIVTFMGVVIYSVHYMSQFESGIIQENSVIAMHERSRCYDDRRAQTTADIEACLAQAQANFDIGVHDIQHHRLADIAETWGFYLVAASFWSFLAALAIRTIGWVALGFSRSNNPPAPESQAP